MKAQRWKEIDAIVAASLEREPSFRAPFLDEACAGDEELRQEVESLIAHVAPDSVVECQAVEEATRLLATGELRGLERASIERTWVGAEKEFKRASSTTNGKGRFTQKGR